MIFLLSFELLSSSEDNNSLIYCTIIFEVVGIIEEEEDEEDKGWLRCFSSLAAEKSCIINNCYDRQYDLITFGNNDIVLHDRPIA